jgi:hypothetical protein
MSGLETNTKRWESCGELWNALHTAVEKERKFKWTESAKDDALNRISRTLRELKLPETPLEIFTSFAAHQFPEHFVIEEHGLRRRRNSNSATSEKGSPTPKHRPRQH